jgi:acetylornithine/succinyldiaminopimelate/putrescine aminotransferase
MTSGSHRASMAPGQEGLPRIVSASNDVLIDDTGHRLIDMFSANGAALLGHAHPAIAAGVRAQLDSVWLTGGLPTPVLDVARTAIEALLPEPLCFGGLYSTGMEAAEFAMRIARVHTGRDHFLGFGQSMHGKSAWTAALGWANAPASPQIHRLPAWYSVSRGTLLGEVERCLSLQPVAAVFLEPVLGSGGGHVAPAALCADLADLCRRHGSLLVADEILCGLYRSGPLFAFANAGLAPDVVLLGKALGNGFPVSAVALRRDIDITPAMLPGSTYAGNPLAAAAVVATLEQMRLADVQARVAAIERQVESLRAALPGLPLRGRGALWLFELPGAARAQQVVRALYRRGVFANCAAHYLRWMPAATITPDHLRQACEALVEALEEPMEEAAGESPP